MSGLRELIKESKITKKELVATTVRIPKELNSFVEGFADYLSITKQETLLKLIEEGVSIAENELKLDEPQESEVSTRFYLLNTNKRHNIADHDQMINKGEASAFYDPWKKTINRIKKDDCIFLYENGKGIVAYGFSTGTTLKRSHNGNIDECYYQELTNFKVLDNPLSAKEIKSILGRNFPFLATMSGMVDGDLILEKIKKSNQNMTRRINRGKINPRKNYSK